VYDPFINMNVKKKLNALGVGVVTYERVGRSEIDREAAALYKKPFWTFARDYYGAAAALCRTNAVDGILYLSAFACGVDSVVTALIESCLGDFPFMVLKLDEHTGEAGFDTRLEAFSDLLKRRRGIGRHLPAYGQYRTGDGSAVPGA
jgi:predicted nucleotide-binding protein (sugar kinase/HSP70/actin superfamily)